MTNTQEVIGDILSYQYDPTRIASRMLDLISESVDGNFQILVDPSNPFAKIIDSQVVLTTAFLEKDAINTNRQYERLAQTQEELFLHMSDIDYKDRFATPAKAPWTILMPKDEAISRMVDDPATNSKKLVIPRNSYYTVGDVVFSQQYPIVISQQTHGGIQVLYDRSKPSPLQELETNVVKSTIRNVRGVEWLMIEFDVLQFKINNSFGDLSAAKEFTKTIPLDDYFYYARIYYQSGEDWVEMETTHSQQVYDITKPTAVLTVVDKQVQVRIPQVYTNTGTLKGKLRMDIYQTKGAIQMNMATVMGDEFGATWEAYDKKDETPYVAPIRSFHQIIPYSDALVSGGSGPLPFLDLRSRVINRTSSADRQLPITNVQLEDTLKDIGYEMVRDVDNLTNRVLLATRSMPSPIDPKLITAAASSMATLSVKMTEAVALDTVIDNGKSITILPTTLYRNVGGVTSMVPSAQAAALYNLPPDKLALAVTGGGYTYSPFHYVLDTTGVEFDTRAYYLDSPMATVKNFIDANPTTQLRVTTQGYGIFKTASGFMIQIVTDSDDAYKALNDDLCHVQLAYVPALERDRAYLNGVYAGRTSNNERIFNFDLSSTLNVNADHKLELTEFKMYTDAERITGAGLDTTFDILYSTSSVLDVTWVPNGIDQILGNFLLPNSVAAVAHETIDIHFGDALRTLWTRAKTVVTASPYQTWDVDVPMIYQKDVYETDADGNTVIVENGEVVFNILHQKGDPVLNNGVPVIQYHKGDIKLDPVTGQPVPVGERGLTRQIEVMMIEGSYLFATDNSAVQYRAYMNQLLVQWLMKDLGGLTGKLLDQTRIYFYPKATQGYINVSLGDGKTTSLEAGQAFKVDLHMPDASFRDDKLKKQLSAATVSILASALNNATISMSDITPQLREIYGDDVSAFTVTGLGGVLDLPVLTVVDGVNRCSLRKRLEAQPDGSLIVREDVTFNFIPQKSQN